MTETREGALDAARATDAAGETMLETTRQYFDVTPTYERPGSGAIVVGDTLCVAAASEDEAREFIAGLLVDARLTPICIDVTLATTEARHAD